MQQKTILYKQRIYKIFPIYYSPVLLFTDSVPCYSIIKMKTVFDNNISFKSIYTNRTVKKGFELASSNGALFGASATVAFSAMRPISIMCTPKTDKENRKIAAAKSITSSLINFGLMLAFSIPLAASIKKIDNNPKKYLKKETVRTLKEKGKELTDSKGYIFGTQLFKLGIASLVAIPKAIMTASGMPYIVTSFSSKKEENKNISFHGLTDKTAKGIGNTLNNKRMLKFTDRFKDSNFPMHITALTDTIATLAFIQQANVSKKIEENRKKTLIYNAGISTALSIAGGYTIDKLLDKPTEKFIEKYKNANRSDKNLAKQIQGIKIAKPFLILGTIYYILIPFISTFLAEKADNSRE